MKYAVLSVLCYLLIINIAAFIVYGVDKSRAVKSQWRISEKTLILLAVFGGSIGAMIGMMKFHHKTKHIKFYVGVPLILIVHISAALFVLYYAVFC